MTFSLAVDRGEIDYLDGFLIERIKITLSEKEKKKKCFGVFKFRIFGREEHLFRIRLIKPFLVGNYLNGEKLFSVKRFDQLDDDR